jgi:hypothetical protein
MPTTDLNPLTLKALLTAHFSAPRSRGSLSGVMGDAYLLDRNPIYAAARALCKKSKIIFTEASTPLAKSCALLSLTPMYRTRSVFYRPNIAAFQEIERLAPGRFSLDELDGLGIATNSLLHESVHLLWFFDHFKGWRAFSAQKLTPRSTLAIQMGESLAVTAETLSQLHARGAVGEALLTLNLVTFDRHPRMAGLKRLQKGAGPEFTARVLFLSLLLSNFLYESLDDDLLDTLIELSARGLKISPSAKAEARSLAPHLLDRLAPGFRLGTAKFYFAMLGHKEDVTEVLDQNPISSLKRDPKTLKRAFQIIRELCVFEKPETAAET